MTLSRPDLISSPNIAPSMLLRPRSIFHRSFDNQNPIALIRLFHWSFQSCWTPRQPPEIATKSDPFFLNHSQLCRHCLRPTSAVFQNYRSITNLLDLPPQVADNSSATNNPPPSFQRTTHSPASSIFSSSHDHLNSQIDPLFGFGFVTLKS